MPYVIVDENRAVRQVPERGIRGRVFLDENIVHVHPHAVGVRYYENVATRAAWMLADIHARRDIQDVPRHGGVLLARVDERRHLRVPEHIHDAVVADIVAGTEILVRVVVERAPSASTRTVSTRGKGVENLRVAQRVLRPEPLAVERLRREHMPVVFRDHESFSGVGDALFRKAAVVRPVEAEIVERVDILKEAAVLEEPDPARRTRRIQAVRDSVRPCIEFVVVLALVYPDAPNEDRRMVPVLKDHVPDVLHRNVLPFSVADMLPSGNLGEDEKPDFVAPVNEMPALRIMRRPDLVQP